MNNNSINITQPSLPPLSDFIPYLEKIWESKILTNSGEYHQALEIELAKYLGVKYISLFANGTLALVVALKALSVGGEVITTPYSFVATTHALLWNNIKPVFIDINYNDCNINPEKIEAAITSKTTAILAVHVYGNPCNINEIQKVADFYGLRVIYDAAHAFGVEIKGESILNFGDLSVLSFHATKVFNTFEGGAIICHDEKTKIKIDRLKNFGFSDEVTVSETGINAKMNEFQAAFGLLQLKYFEKNIIKRKNIIKIYRDQLKDLKGIRFLNDIIDVKHNCAYFPIFVCQKKYGMERDELYKKFITRNIYCRRYFYPLISQFPMYRKFKSANPSNLPIAEKIAKQVVCLPLYSDLSNQNLQYIIKSI